MMTMMMMMTVESKIRQRNTLSRGARQSRRRDAVSVCGAVLSGRCVATGWPVCVFICYEMGCRF